MASPGHPILGPKFWPSGKPKGRPPGSKNKPRAFPNGAALPNLSTNFDAQSEAQALAMRVAQENSHDSLGNYENRPMAQESAPGIRTSRSVVRASFREAAEIIREPETRGEGFRHGWLGNTGTGKTTCIRKFLIHFPIDGITVIHDDTKRIPQYSEIPGHVVCQDFQSAPNETSIVTVRGNPLGGQLVEPEELATYCIKMGMSGIPVRYVIDELDRACTPGGMILQGREVRTCLVRGRALSLSVLWSTQAPQRAPREFVDQSTTIALCQLGPRAINYLGDRLLFDPELLDIIPRLQVGEFVLYEQGKNWNKRIYY